MAERRVRVAIVLDVAVMDDDWTDKDLRVYLPGLLHWRLRKSESDDPYRIVTDDVTVYAPEDDYAADLLEIQAAPSGTGQALAKLAELSPADRLDLARPF